ncbi:hypothetical protein BH11BAC1_BH11BAC1_05910 [soil metagenome]
MKRITFLISFFLVAVATLAQVQTVTKAGVAKPEIRFAEISAVAIPYDLAGSVVIDSSIYHKAVGMVEEDSKTIQLSAVAQTPPAANGAQAVKKEAVESKHPVTDSAKNPFQRVIEVKVAVEKR